MTMWLHRWLGTSQHCVALWLSERKPAKLYPAHIQQMIDEAEFDAMVYRIDPEPKYEEIWQMLEKEKHAITHT